MGVGAGYSLRINGVELNIETVKLVSDIKEVSGGLNETYINSDDVYNEDEVYDNMNTDSYVEWECEIRPQFVDYWEAEHSYWYINSKGDINNNGYYDEMDEYDRKIEGGFVRGVLWLGDAIKEGELPSNPTKEEIIEYIKIDLKDDYTSIDLKSVIGGGYSTHYFNDDGLIEMGKEDFKTIEQFRSICVPEYNSGLNAMWDTDIFYAEITSPNIAGDINWYIDNWDKDFSEFEEDSLEDFEDYDSEWD